MFMQKEMFLPKPPHVYDAQTFSSPPDVESQWTEVEASIQTRDDHYGRRRVPGQGGEGSGSVDHK